MKLNKIIAISFLITGISCTRSVDLAPVSVLDEQNYYQSTAEVETGVLGCYAALRDVYNIDFYMAGLRSDDAYVSVSEGDANQIDGFTEVPTNSLVSGYWQESYFLIKQCNTVLKYLPNVTDSVKKQYFEGEAKFLRANAYFNLVRYFGDVPLVTSSIKFSDSVAYIRADKQLVYQQIISDFTDASNKLPSSWTDEQTARVTNYAAQGMLARVYMTLRDFSSAKNILSNLLSNSGKFQLLSDYRKIFGIANEMNNEILFAVRYKSMSNGLGNIFSYHMDKLPGSLGFRAASDFRGNTNFPAADSIRKSQTFLIYPSSTGSLSFYTGGKYQDITAPRADAGADFIVLRYADIIMMYAEAENEINGNTPLTASDATTFNSRLFQLNRIRTRAGVAPYAFSSSLVSTQNSFRNTIKAERRREFGEESQRWFDLIRWGDAVNVMNAHFQSRGLSNFVEPTDTLYAIPQREIDISAGKMKQNPGYN